MQHETLKMSLEEALEHLWKDLSNAMKGSAHVGVVFKGFSTNGEDDFDAVIDPGIIDNPFLLKQTFLSLSKIMDERGSVRWLFGGYLPKRDLVFIQYGDRRMEKSISTARTVERYESGAVKGFGPEMIPETQRVTDNTPATQPKLEPEIEAALSQAKGSTKH